MPVYQYQGKHYELKETDPAAAKERIKSFLGETEKPSQAAAFGKSAFESLGGAGGALAGAAGGAALGALTGPLAPIASPVLGIGGALAGGFGGSKLQEAAGKYVPESVKKATGFEKKTREAETKEFPVTSTLGEFAPDIVSGGRILYSAAKPAIQKGAQLISRFRGKPLEASLKTMGTSVEELAKSKTSASAAKELAESQKLTEEQARRGVAQRSVVRQLETTADLAKQESASTLSKIAKPSNDFELGSNLREKVSGVQSRLIEAANKKAEELKGIYFAEGAAKEKAGQYWSQSNTGREFMRYLDDVLNIKNRGKYTEYEIGAAKNIKDMLKDVEIKSQVLLATGKPATQVVRSELPKIEKIIRDVKKLPSQPTATGADALKQQYMGKMAQKLEDSVYGYVDEAGTAVSGFAPTGRVFRETYRDMMKPLNTYESPVGKILTQEVEGLKGIFSADVTSIPKAVFRSPQQIQVLERMGISKDALQPYAARYTANQLENLKTADDVAKWLKSANASYLNEFPELAKKATDYARVFSKNEQTIKGTTEAAEKIRESIKTGSKTINEQISKLRSMKIEDREFISNGLFKFSHSKNPAQEARTYTLGLKDRGIINADEANKIIEKIIEVEKQIKDKESAKTALKGILPYLGAAGLFGGTAVAGYSLNKLLGGL